MIYWVEGTLVNRRLVMWCEGVGEGEVFCGPIIRSQSFREAVSLDCEHQKSFSAFFSPLTWDRMG